LNKTGDTGDSEAFSSLIGEPTKKYSPSGTSVKSRSSNIAAFFKIILCIGLSLEPGSKSVDFQVVPKRLNLGLDVSH
jgi:hypothetical protein